MSAEPGERIDLTVEPRFDGLRIDQYLAKKLPEMSRSYIQKLIDGGAVRIDGIGVRRSDRVAVGEQVEFDVPETRPYEVVAEDLPLDVVYEDEALLIIDKPAGLVVHPTTNQPGGTLVNALLWHCDDLSGINGVERPGIVHRIDKDTTGLLVVAKHDVAHRHLSDQFREHSIDRLYVCLVYGGAPFPREGTITGVIGRDPRNRKRMASLPEGATSGKHAVTHYRTAEDYKAVAMVECSLETGRTHQIRVHLSEAGHPLVGDPVYGGLKTRRLPHEPAVRGAIVGHRGQMLHAAALGFIHPTRDEYMRWTRPPHAAMLGAVQALRASVGIDPDADGPWDRTETGSFGAKAGAPRLI